MRQVIPRQLCDNAGFDATDVLNRLRQRHAAKDGSGSFFGVDVNTGALSKSHHTHCTMQALLVKQIRCRPGVGEVRLGTGLLFAGIHSQDKHAASSA